MDNSKNTCIIGVMYSRLLKPPGRKSFFLLGPRGTGKTTWVKAVFPDALWVDLLEARHYNSLLADPQRLDALVPEGFKDWVVLDEVQKIPALLDEVHRLIEKRRLKFVLTGSSARKLRRGASNLLGGRALTFPMHPLTAAEMGKDFDLGRALRFGLLPAVPSEDDPRRFLDSYVHTYLEQEVKQEGYTRNLAAFARFLEAASFSQGAVLNMSAVARECSVERKVVENYYGILDDLMIAHQIPVFTKRSKRRLAFHPKFFSSTSAFSARCAPPAPGRRRKRKGPLSRPCCCRISWQSTTPWTWDTRPHLGAPRTGPRSVACFMGKRACWLSRSSAAGA